MVGSRGVGTAALALTCFVLLHARVEHPVVWRRSPKQVGSQPAAVESQQSRCRANLLFGDRRRFAGRGGVVSGNGVTDAGVCGRGSSGVTAGYVVGHVSLSLEQDPRYGTQERNYPRATSEKSS